LRCKNEPLVAKYQDPFTVRSDHLLKGTGSTADRQYKAIQNDSVLFLFRDEFLPNSEKFLFVSGLRRRRPRHQGNFNAGHDFGNAQLHEGGGKALIAELKTF
jgi:hypothetical protein